MNKGDWIHEPNGHALNELTNLITTMEGMKDMAKHPHRLMLLNKKTWRCTLEGCTFFVHLGLVHILWGKSAVCWTCNEVYTLDQEALKEEMPNCPECRSGKSGISLDAIEQFTNNKLALAKEGVSDVSELSPGKRRLMETMGLIKPIGESFNVPDVDIPIEADEIEVYNPIHEEESDNEN